jgi:hypothetical protein
MPRLTRYTSSESEESMTIALGNLGYAVHNKHTGEVAIYGNGIQSSRGAVVLDAKQWQTLLAQKAKL